MKVALAAWLAGGALFFTPTNVAAQDSPAEVFAFGTIQRLWDDEGSLGTGLGGGGGARIALTDRLSIRARVIRAVNERNFDSGVLFDAITTRYSAELLWQLSASAHAPYVGVGTGGLAFTRRSVFPNDPRNFERSGSDSLIGGLGGVSAVTTNRFRLQPEAGLWWSRPNNFIVIEFGIVASIRF